MKLAAALHGVTHLAIDTPPFIYFVEFHPQYIGLVAAVFRQIDLGQLEGITSVITLGEPGSLAAASACRPESPGARDSVEAVGFQLPKRGKPSPPVPLSLPRERGSR